MAAIGVNCVAPEDAVPLVGAVAEVVGDRAAVVAYPNAGFVEINDTDRWRFDSWTELARELYDAGARWIGGCCGVSPAAIELMANALP